MFLVIEKHRHKSYVSMEMLLKVVHENLYF